MVSLASYALDGMSLVASGKSLSDHALSAVAESDCALWRIVQGQPICRAYTQTAAVSTADSRPLWSDAEPPRRAGRQGDDLATTTPRPAPVAAVPPAPPSPPSPEPAKPVLSGAQHYLVLASFRDARPAEQLAAAHRELDASVRSADVGGARWYRVVVGPASLAALTPVQQRLGGAGLERPWLVKADEAEAPRFSTLALQLGQRP